MVYSGLAHRHISLARARPPPAAAIPRTFCNIILYTNRILGVGAESCAFQRESTESGECAEESDKYDGEILLVGLEFGAAVDKEEPGDKSPGHVNNQCSPRESRKSVINISG